MSPNQEPSVPSSPSRQPAHPLGLAARYRAVRAATEQLCAPLSPEDCAIQSMPDASPSKWHLAHTSWFFETFVLERADPGYAHFEPAYRVLFNSYYNAVGEQYTRSERGLLSRPSLSEVYRYRAHVDAAVLALLESGAHSDWLPGIAELGLHHEQQHQELIATDIKHMLSNNPMQPACFPARPAPLGAPGPLRWHGVDAGLREVGHEGAGFAFDNEGPRHRQYLEAFELASRPVTNGEYLAFLAEDAYTRPELWLSDGWAWLQTERIRAPLYWHQRDGEWYQFTLHGARPVRAEEPVTHVSFFEAVAYAEWAGARLPGESDWECVAEDLPVEGNFVESGLLHPAPPEKQSEGMQQLFGDVWEWTRSDYRGYPGYSPGAGALGEYNGKFMCNQIVLRGGSCATPRSHIRASYRNFFPPSARWQFSGIRLARDA